MDRIPAIRRVILSDLSQVARAGWAVVAVVLPTVLRWLIDKGEAGIPFVTYFPAVVLQAIRSWPAIFCWVDEIIS